MKTFIIIQILFLASIAIGFIISLLLRKKAINITNLGIISYTMIMMLLLYDLIIKILNECNEQIEALLNINFIEATFFIFLFPILAFSTTVFFLRRYAKRKSNMKKSD